MRTIRSVPSSAVLAVSLTLLHAQFANAANLTWTNAAGGFAGTAANWNPAQVPAAADWLRFNLAGSYPVTFGSAVPASTELLVENGRVTFRFPTAHTVSTVLAMPANGTSSEATIESGRLDLARNLYLGQTAGDTATLTITGAGTTVNATNPAGVVSVGDQGAAILNVLSGASLTLAQAPEFGDRAGGSGTFVAISSGTQVVVNNAADDPVEFGSNGTGAGGVLNGAFMRVDGPLQLGRGTGGNGSFSIAGVSGTDSARLEVGGDLWIAHNANAGSAAGAGTFHVGSGGIAEVAGTTMTYDDDGSAGQIQLREGGRFETGSLLVDEPAAELDLQGGTLQVRGGVMTTGSNPLTLNSATGTPTLELLGGAHATLYSTTNPTLVVGSDDAGALRVLGGSDLTVSSHDAIVGDNFGSDGTLEVNGIGSTLTVEHALVVANRGVAAMNVGGGSQATLQSVLVGAGPDGSGRVTIADAGTSVHVANAFDVASNNVFAKAAMGSISEGIVTVRDGASLWLDQPGVSGNIRELGEVYVWFGGTLHLTGSLVNRGSLSLTAGSTSGGAIQTIAGGRLYGSGEARSSIFAVLDTTGRIEPQGLVLAAHGASRGVSPAATAGFASLTLGDPASPVGYHFLGQLDVGSHEVTLQDADSAVVGSTLLAGGRLYAPPGGLSLAPGHRLRGNGSVHGTFRPQGYVLPTGTGGLTFSGLVIGTGQGMNGSRIRFASGGGFLGGGTIAASVAVDSGAIVAPTGDAALGSAPNASRVDVSGNLVVGPGIDVAITGTDSTRVGGTVAMLGGVLLNGPTSPLVVRPAGRLAGAGTVLGLTLVDGTLDPGTGRRRLEFAGLGLGATSHTLFDVGAYPGGDLDTLAVIGIASLGGSLDLRTTGGFVPVVGDSFRVLTCATRVGQFAAVTVNGVAAPGAVELLYKTDGAWVRILGAVDAPGAGPIAGTTLSFASLDSPARTLAFALELPEPAQVTLELFDASGRRVATLHDGALAAGRHRFDERGTAPAGGLYFARATVRGPSGARVRTARAVRLP